MSSEAALREYLAPFDGTNKDFLEVVQLFSSVFHEKTVFDAKFALVLKNRKTLTRDDIKELYVSHLSKGSKIKLLHFKRIGLNCIDVQVQVGNEKENDVVRMVYSIEDNKIVKARQVVDDCLFSVAKARFTNRRFRLQAHLKDISS